MTRPAGGAREHVERRSLHARPRRQQHGRVEVALHAALVADDRPAGVERDAPVEPEHVAAARPAAPSSASVTPVPKWMVGASTAARIRAEYGSTNSV